MRLLAKSLAAACAAAAVVVTIAGCGPAQIGLGTAANTSSVAPTATTSGPGAASPASAPPAAGQTAGAAAPAAASAGPAASAVPAATAASGGVVTALSIVVTPPVYLPTQTTAIIAGRLTEPGNGNAPLAGRVVWLERLGANGWLLFRPHVTGPDGAVAFQVHVWVGAAFRLVYAGTPSLDRAASPIRIIVR